MTGPTIPSRFQKYPDARDREHHGGGVAWGACIGFFGWTAVALVAAIVWWV